MIYNGGVGVSAPDSHQPLLEVTMTPQEDYRIIPLTKGQFTIVDAADFDWLNQWKWYAAWQHINYYARSGGNLLLGYRSGTSMARLILGLRYGDERMSDHINHNTLDNRRSNLRIATRSQNTANRKKLKKNKSSKYRGVTLRSDGSSWAARVQINNRCIPLGHFQSELDAALAYDQKAAYLHGDFVILNFPPEDELQGRDKS